LLGCNIITVRKHIEKQFRDGMTWSNYGHGKNKWLLDHVNPISKFNLECIEERMICFNYNNLQPLWSCENLKKGNNINFLFEKPEQKR